MKDTQRGTVQQPGVGASIEGHSTTAKCQGLHPPLITMLSVTGESFLIKGMFSSSLIPTSSTLTVPIGLVSIIFGASGSFPAMVHKKHMSIRQILQYKTEHYKLLYSMLKDHSVK